MVEKFRISMQSEAGGAPEALSTHAHAKGGRTDMTMLRIASHRSALYRTSDGRTSARSLIMLFFLFYA
jgi:hypothetical protein